MKRCRVVRSTLVATGALVVALVAPGVDAAPGTSVPSFEEFRASTVRDADQQYIVNGDEPVANTAALRSYYEGMVGTASPKLNEAGLVVNTVGGSDDRWTRAEVGRLTYCVSNRFAARKAAVVRAAAQGAALWENASSAIDYVRVRSADASCTTRNNRVVFSIEPTASQAFIARAFFPSSRDNRRNILINPVSLLTTPDWPARNILGHELGHTLGFRHEHTRPEAGVCFEDVSWRPLTDYDSASIMHYPQCNGTSTDLSFTATDAEGVAELYGP
ncbi:MAG TPA: hypothetical protein VFY58_01675 [Nocardioides sp.]|nr:hypothetical protein [Nocardioides sp.]